MKSASKITLIYFIISFFWILFSDRFIHSIVDDADLLTKLQTYKGWFFVISTSIFLYILIRQEIGRQHKLLAELKKAKEKAEESDRLKSAFLSNMSHEIRTPLNGLVGFSQLLCEEEEDADTRQLYIDQVNQNSDLLLKIINNILDISKIQENLIIPNPTDVPVVKLLQEFEIRYTSLNNTLQQKGLSFQLKIGAECNHLIVKTDKQYLSQILYNFLENAIKYTNRGVITLGCEKENSFIRIYVEDTGIGISAEAMPRIFDRFKQYSKENGNSEGFGLGLSISQGLAQTLNAKIEVSTKPGKGSRFSLLLPQK